MTLILEYIGVALASTIKFVGGPILGVARGLSWTETSLSSVAGMMLSVLVVVYGSGAAARVGSWFFKKKGKRKIFSRTTRLAVKVKRSLGLWGVAFLTPFLFTPILGTFIAVSFRFPKREILLKMLICGIIAGYVQTIAFDLAGDFLMQLKEKFL